MLRNRTRCKKVEIPLNLLAAPAMAIGIAALLTLTSCGAATQKEYFQISVVDDSTGRGVPLVEVCHGALENWHNGRKPALSETIPRRLPRFGQDWSPELPRVNSPS